MGKYSQASTLSGQSRFNPKPPFRLVRIVRPAPELQILDRRRAAICEWHDVMELETACLSASSVPADERTASVIACPDSAPDRGGDVTTSRRAPRRGSWPHRLGLPRLFELIDERTECAIDDGGQVAVRDDMPKQVACAFE